MSKVLTKSIDPDNGNERTIFSGLFAKIEIPKPFNTFLSLRKDMKNKSLFDRDLKELPFDELRIQMDSTEFEKVFDIYASDPIIAMQLLTADIMQELFKFYNEMGIDYELTIKENYIY